MMDRTEENGKNKTACHAGRHSTADIFVLSLVSAACGFVLGTLFAPESGARTRRILVERLRELIDRGKFVFLEARVMGEELLDKGKEKVEEVTSKVKRSK